MTYADPIPELKIEVAKCLVERLEGWSQWNAAAYIRTDQPRISDLRNGRLQRFSLEKLIRLVARSGGTATVLVTWGRRPASR